MGAKGNEWMLLASFLSGLWASIVEVMSLYIRQRKKSVIFITMQSEETCPSKISGMKKFDLNQHNILAQEYYMDLRQEICFNFARGHVDLKPFEVGDRTQESSKCNMQGHLTVRRALKETKSKQLVQFSSGNLLRPLKTAIFMIKLVYLTC